MKSATPRLRPFCTANVWLPNSVPSATTSRNHRIIALSVATNPRATRIPPLANPLKYIAAEIVKVNKANEVSNGQGEGVTKWNFQDKKTLSLRFYLEKIISSIGVNPLVKRMIVENCWFC